MSRWSPTVDPAQLDPASPHLPSDLRGSNFGYDSDPTDSVDSFEHGGTADNSMSGPKASPLVPTFWQRFRYWAWHPVSRSSLAVLLVAGLLPLLLSFAQHLTSSPEGSGPSTPAAVITVPVTISVPVTVTSTPPAPTTGTAPAPPPVTVVRTTVLTTVQTTGGAKPPVPTTSAPLRLIGPGVGAKAVICFTPATLAITATGKGVVSLNVTGAAAVHKSGRGSAKLVVTGRTGTYAMTYAATGGNPAISWSALKGVCS